MENRMSDLCRYVIIPAELTREQAVDLVHRAWDGFESGAVSQEPSEDEGEGVMVVLEDGTELSLVDGEEETVH